MAKEESRRNQRKREISSSAKKTKNTVSRWINLSKDDLKDTWNRSIDDLMEAGDKLKKSVREKPIESVVISALIGAAIASAFGAAMKSQKRYVFMLRTV